MKPTEATTIPVLDILAAPRVQTTVTRLKTGAATATTFYFCGCGDLVNARGALCPACQPAARREPHRTHRTNRGRRA